MKQKKFTRRSLIKLILRQLRCDFWHFELALTPYSKRKLHEV
jgi:hypothetical protein